MRQWPELIWKKYCKGLLVKMWMWRGTNLFGYGVVIILRDWRLEQNSCAHFLLLRLTKYLILKNRTWDSKWAHRNTFLGYWWETNFAFFLHVLDCNFLNHSFSSSQRQTMQEAPDSLFLVKDQLLSRTAPSKLSCLGKLQSMLQDRPRLPKLWAPLHPHL